MEISSINSKKAPSPVGAYPHAKRVGHLLFLSGVGPRLPETGEVPGLLLSPSGDKIKYDIEAEVHSVFSNVRNILEESGSHWDLLIDVTVFLTNMKNDFPIYNRLWREYFKHHSPCRTTVEVLSLPTPISIELKCIATLKTEEA